MLKLCADVLAHASCVGKSPLTTAHVQGWDLTCACLLGNLLHEGRIVITPSTKARPLGRLRGALSGPAPSEMVPKGRAGAFEGPAPADGVIRREALVPGALAAGVAAAAPEAMMDVSDAGAVPAGV
jgi:hypothetical protein